MPIYQPPAERAIPWLHDMFEQEKLIKGIPPDAERDDKVIRDIAIFQGKLDVWRVFCRKWAHA